MVASPRDISPCSATLLLCPPPQVLIHLVQPRCQNLLWGNPAPPLMRRESPSLWNLANTAAWGCSHLLVCFCCFQGAGKKRRKRTGPVEGSLPNQSLHQQPVLLAASEIYRVTVRSAFFGKSHRSVSQEEGTFL